MEQPPRKTLHLNYPKPTPPKVVEFSKPQNKERPTLSLKPKVVELPPEPIPTKKIEVKPKPIKAANGKEIMFGDTPDTKQIIEIAEFFAKYVGDYKTAFFIKNPPPILIKRLTKVLKKERILFSPTKRVYLVNQWMFGEKDVAKLYFYGFTTEERTRIFEVYSQYLNELKENHIKNFKGKNPTPVPTIEPDKPY